MYPDAQIAALCAAEGLGEAYRAIVDDWWAPLAEAIVGRAGGGPLVVGINGAQGSGKSTLAAFLALLLRARGLRVAVLSLDDLYLGRQHRAELARRVHPLFATRGVPGTHDVALGAVLIDALMDRGCAGASVDLPRFDKASDDRAPTSLPVATPVDVVLFEGWCVGAAPMATADLAAPINRLEAEDDPQAIWRRAINAHLAGDYAALIGRIDMLIMLAVPDFACVRTLRGRQEAALAARHPDGAGVMDDAALDRFISHYERLTRAMLAEMPARADVVVRLDAAGRPLAISPLAKASGRA